MAYQNEGEVTMIESRDFPNKRGSGSVTLWSFQIDSSRRYFRMGKKEPDFNEGDFVSFENDDKGNVDYDSIRVGEGQSSGRGNGRRSSSGGGRNSGGSSRTASSGSRGRSGGGSSGGAGQTRDGYWAEKEKRDVERESRYQSVDVPRMSFSAAQERAVHLVSAALAADCLALGSSKGKRLDILLEQVDEVTNRFFLQSMDSHKLLEDLREDGAMNEPAAEVGFDDLDEGEQFDEDWED
jgi:hypothetical protein